MDFLVRDCNLYPITNVLQKKTKKMNFCWFITLIHLWINRYSQTYPHNRFTKLIDNFRIRDTL